MPCSTPVPAEPGTTPDPGAGAAVSAAPAPFPAGPAEVTEATLDAALREVWPALRAYVSVMLGAHRHRVDDVLQDTAVWVWEHRYDLPKVNNFTGWIFRAAYFKTLSCRRDLARERALVVDDSVFERIAEAAAEVSADTGARLQALGECLAALEPEDRELLQSRYRDRRPLVAVAAAMRQSLNAVHQRLWRLRRTLRRCVAYRLMPRDAGDA